MSIKKKSNERSLKLQMKKSLEVSELLRKVTPSPFIESSLPDEVKVEKITHLFGEIMEVLGLDLSDDSLQNTPKRVAKMYVQELFRGMNPHHFPKITTVENKMGYSKMILVKDIHCLSTCEHHFVTIDGVATVAYIPRKKLIGLSKINRIVGFFARRPQVQERLTQQIADCLQLILETEDVAVIIRAKHYCVISRGVEDRSSSTTTLELRGEFEKNPLVRGEFLRR